MADLKEQCGILIVKALNSVKAEMGLEGDVGTDTLVLETPPNPQMGDVGVPMFPFAKVFRMAPPVIAQKVAEAVKKIDCSGEVGEFFATGPYVNVRLNKEKAIAAILEYITDESQSLGLSDDQGREPLKGRRVMIEFSSPNTNKPLHLGHLRNDALGESISRILKEAGAEVFKVNIINNRGVHICKSMLAYKKFHEPKGETPESLGIKSDRFVGDCYVEFDKWSKEDATAETQAQDLLVQWEKGDKEVHELWNTMNQWAIAGITQTYKRTGVSFDKLYYESETYLKGKEEILKGLESGIFYREEDGSVWVDLAEINLDKKVLLRKDGTALYMTQDVGTAIYRHNDWAFNQLVYVVGSEQQYHFKVLFYVLKKLGYDWANQLYHLSYGMVNLPEGKMKSREGTVVDADDLIDSLRDGALEEITSKGREEAVGDAGAVAENIALGALHYYLLQTTPTKDMLFNPKESLSFNGNTGPYLQYMGARICSILRRAQEEGVKPLTVQEAAPLLNHEAEWELIKTLGQYAKIIVKAAETLDPSVVAGYLYDIAKSFSRFYHECPALSLAKENPSLAAARLLLITCTKTVLERGLRLILVPFLEAM
ncbi:MAG: arginine--tRNA ligase [Candidatus Treponema excrementipullorum]|uniref:Arginine--tRNA ligase n=1 Tax=Candidatus Treponema excrementipullorum TaxID=2838768 RepID=A0A9E2NZQ2_9SPIR|nr:arginine--tRNA ligase [Candidatus Treponema excrementipullorum]